MNGDVPLWQTLERLVQEEKFDQALDLLEKVATTRSLSTCEIVNKGRWTLLSEGRPGRQPEDALRLFESVLAGDRDNVAALTEIGWYYYAVENDAQRARPHFLRAVDVATGDLHDSLEGLMNCVREIEGDDAVRRDLADFAGRLVDVERIRAALVPVVPAGES